MVCLLPSTARVTVIHRSRLFLEALRLRNDDRIHFECRTPLTKGEEGAALPCARLGGSRSEDARALAHRLHPTCERRGSAEEAPAYNALVVSRPAIQERAARLATTGRQSELFQVREES